ncbi:hypothetical protein AVEN_235053-1 [Araneus ventricosus]|uniref:Uncharacterized protein n=1 Tax=Araneus ventricosus TaxID=182803 RepID=A0A4Y2F0R6_ARAVE|nr:hypothetical protein AVEN_235053-1 [Araneus ventricosus]
MSMVQISQNPNKKPWLDFVRLYLRPVLKQHEGYFGTDLVILNLGQMTRTTPERTHPLQTSATPGGRCLATTYNLACSRPHTRRIISGVGFRVWDPPTPSRNFTTRLPRP